MREEKETEGVGYWRELKKGRDGRGGEKWRERERV